MRTPIPILILSVLAGTLSCTKETSLEQPGYQLKVHFRPISYGLPIHYGDSYYNPQGEDYRLSMLRLYLGNFWLADETGAIASFPDTYYLLDIGDSSSLIVSLHANAKPFRRIGFQLGIDSTRNVSGAQTGALDPTYGMFWTWNTGYINVRMEGNSSRSQAADGRFEYHIGGFRTGESTQRSIQLDLPGGQNHVLDETRISEARIDIDINKWFRSAHELPISQNARITSPGPLAVLHADNAARMFSLESILLR